MIKYLAIVAAVLGANCFIVRSVNGQPGCRTQNSITKSVGDPTEDFLIALAQRESSGDKQCVNDGGYLGLFQMGGRALADAGFYKLGQSRDENAWDGRFSERAGFVDVVSRDTYLGYAGAQELAVRAYHAILWSRIGRLQLNGKIGTVIDNVKLTKSGMLAGSHLVGIGGLLQFVRSNGKIIPRDGNGVPITEYINELGSYY